MIVKIVKGVFNLVRKKNKKKAKKRIRRLFRKLLHGNAVQRSPDQGDRAVGAAVAASVADAEIRAVGRGRKDPARIRGAGGGCGAG